MTHATVPKTLHTARLRLLPAHGDLAPETLAYFTRNAAHLARWDPPVPPDFTTEDGQRERLHKAAADAMAGTTMRWWMQSLDDPSRLIGNLGLSQIFRGVFQNAMLGYSIDAGFEGQGLMREALQAVIQYAFSPEVNLHRIQANVRIENQRSIALLQRLGFDEEGLAREYLFIDGAWRDHRMFAIRNQAFVGPVMR